MLKRPFCGMAAGFLLGILTAAYKENGALLAVVAVGSVIYFCRMLFRLKDDDSLPEKNRDSSGGVRWGRGQLILRMVLCIVMFLLGGSQYTKEQEIRAGYLPYLEENMQLLVQGKLCKKEFKNNQYIYELRSCLVKLDRNETSEKVPVSCNRILVYSDSDVSSIGEILVVNGTIELWESARNEGNFDEKSFYEARKLDFGLKDIHILASYGRRSWWREGAWQLRLRLKEVYQNVMEPEEGGVMATMVLGDKSLLDAKIKRLYQIGGLSHIMAISGLHISVIGMSLYRFLRKRGLGAGIAGVLAGGTMYVYGVMVGMGISVQRALFMFLLLLIAPVAGRTYDTLNALGAAAVVLLWENPYLIWDAGFQFSFAAILGAAWVGKCVTFAGKERSEPGMENGNPAAFRRQRMGKTADKLFVSGAIQLTTLPLVAWYYYEIPLYALVTNLVILPMMGILLSLGLVGGFAGLLSQKAAAVLLFPCEKMLSFGSFLCGLCSALPGAMRITGRPGFLRIVIYYGLLAGVTLWVYRGKRCREAQKKKALDKKSLPMKKESVQNRFGSGKMAAVSIFLILLLCVPVRGGFELDILDVGQGDASFLRTGQGYTVFVDGGSSNVKKVGTYRISPFLKYKGVREIDYWFVSHTDEDHISGLRELLEEGYAIRHLVFSREIVQDEKLWGLLELAEQQETEVLYLNAGDVLHLGEAQLLAVFPPMGEQTALDGAAVGEVAGAETTGEKGAMEKAAVDKNASSLVLWYEEGDFSGIFTGDIGSTEERKLLEVLEEMCLSENIGGLEVDFYKAAHHGSKYSNSSELLDALRPEIAVISCAKKNSYGHPGEEAVAHMEEAGSEVYYTMESGQITVKIEEGVKVYEFAGE